MPRVESILADASAAFRLPAGELEALQVALIRDRLEFHYHANPLYRRLCDEQRLSPAGLRTAADLARIPLLPVRAFKGPEARELLSVKLDEIDLELQSTGTGGVPSVARRDAATTTRAFLGILALYREFFGISGGAGLFLCPSPAEAPEVGMVKAYNLLCGFLDDRAYLVRECRFDPEEAVATLRGWADRHTRHVLGPPFAVARLLRYLEERDLRLPLDPGTLVITLGGWKRFNRERIGRAALEAGLRERLSVPATQVRDMYGLIESNLLAIECGHHRKHLPPWCRVTVRDPRAPSRELPAGQAGAIGILDALSQSYPGFLLSEDVGRLEPAPCPCGRTGQVVRFLRRLEGAELGCCAVTIERNLAEREACHA